jgi:hypothetical protein
VPAAGLVPSYSAVDDADRRVYGVIEKFAYRLA